MVPMGSSWWGEGWDDESDDLLGFFFNLGVAIVAATIEIAIELMVLAITLAVFLITMLFAMFGLYDDE